MHVYLVQSVFHFNRLSIQDVQQNCLQSSIIHTFALVIRTFLQIFTHALLFDEIMHE